MMAKTYTIFDDGRLGNVLRMVAAHSTINPLSLGTQKKDRRGGYPPVLDRRCGAKNDVRPVGAPNAPTNGQWRVISSAEGVMRLHIRARAGHSHFAHSSPRRLARHLGPSCD